MKNIFYIIGVGLLLLAMVRIGTAYSTRPIGKWHRYCSTNSAYSHGYNDAYRGRKAKNYAAECAAKKRDNLNSYYIKGFKKALADHKNKSHRS